MINQATDNGSAKDGDDNRQTLLPENKPSRSFRLVKHFSYAGIVIIFLFTIGLTPYVSFQDKKNSQEKNEDFLTGLTENLNQPAFREFVLTAVLVRERPIRPADHEQGKQLDKVDFRPFVVSRSNGSMSITLSGSSFTARAK